MFNGLSQILLPIVGILIGLAIAVLLFWMIIRAIIEALKGIIAAVRKVPFALGTIFLFLRQYPSVIGMVGVNLIPFAGVIWYDWTPFSVIFIYWLQTGIIGFFSLLKIKKVAEFSEPELQIRVIAFAVWHSGKPRPVSEIIHDFVGVYVFGMFTSLLFLIFFTWFESIDVFSFGALINSPFAFAAAIQESIGVIFLGITTFFLNHGYSYIFNFVGKKEFLHSDLPAQLSDSIDRVGMIWGSLFITATTLVFIPYLTTVVAVLVVYKIMFDVYAHLKEHGRYFYWQYGGQIQGRGGNLGPDFKKSV